MTGTGSTPPPGYTPEEWERVRQAFAAAKKADEKAAEVRHDVFEIDERGVASKWSGPRGPLTPGYYWKSTERPGVVYGPFVSGVDACNHLEAVLVFDMPDGRYPA